MFLILEKAWQRGPRGGEDLGEEVEEPVGAGKGWTCWW